MRVSFVVPSYQSATWLPHACSSVLQQTHKDIELVVVDDGSTDRTQEYTNWVRKQDDRVHVIHNGKNLGRSASRNIGNRAASGDIICVLDADDLATPNRAELMARKFKVSDAEYIYGSTTGIDVLGKPVSLIQADVFNRERADATLKNHIVHSSVAYTKSFAERFPYRNGELEKLGCDDWAQQTEAVYAGVKFDFVPQRVCCYRLAATGISATRDESLVEPAKRGFLAGLKVAA